MKKIMPAIGMVLFSAAVYGAVCFGDVYTSCGNKTLRVTVPCGLLGPQTHTCQASSSGFYDDVISVANGLSTTINVGEYICYWQCDVFDWCSGVTIGLSSSQTRGKFNAYGSPCSA
ncbi:MAG: hypothetical protein JNN07_13685 [Verrucomicrobiales bacterium]|nr:hypothetical protein [Verrucomicrobiales bacterium]